MNYKPDESTLIAYLCGELEEKEHGKLQQFFLEHPEELKKMQEMESVLKIMGTIKDKEVIAPPVFMDHEPAVIHFWKSTGFKTTISIAACLALLMVGARWLGTEVGYSNHELRISFGRQHMETPVHVADPPALSAMEVQNMINASWVSNRESMTRDWTESQKNLASSIRKNLDINSKKVDDLVNSASTASQDQLRSFVAGLRDENLRLMKDYFQLSSTEQKKYVENLLGDFSKYLQEQRKQDLTLVQSRVNNIEKNSDQFKQETEQILASIISNSTTKKSSY